VPDKLQQTEGRRWFTL